MTDNNSPANPEADQAQAPDQASAPTLPPAQAAPQPISPQALAQILARGAVPNLGQPVIMAGAPGLQIPAMLGGMLTTQFQQSWQGPYPPPEAVERYEKSLPGTFDRMIKMAEQLQHAQIEEAKEIRVLTHKDQKRGNYLGFATTLVAMGGALVCIRLNAPVVAGVFLSVPVMAVAKALIESSRPSPAAPSVEAPAPLPSPSPVPESNRKPEP